MNGSEATNANGRFAYDGLDRVIHEKARLSILTALVAHPRGVVFTDLKEFCSLTDGNCSRHIKMLVDAGLVEVWKGTKKNRPQTLFRLTEDGRRRYLEYLGVLEGVLADAQRAKTGVPAENDAVSGIEGLAPA
jgi:DNA-binding MarR family transcriptional regulator